MKLAGDIISDIARALGFKECSGCKRRKARLNAAHARIRGSGRKPKCATCAEARRMGKSS